MSGHANYFLHRAPGIFSSLTSAPLPKVMKRPKQIVERTVVVTTLNPSDWRWFEKEFIGRGLRWQFVYASAPHPFKWLRRPVIGQVIGGFSAAWAARRDKAALSIAIDPRAVLWYSIASFFLRPKCNLIAYGFNFPELPLGFRRWLMAWSFRRPTRFITFSTFEVDLYARYFNLPSHKFESHRWAVRKPEFSENSRGGELPYVCAIGGNARDYGTLFAAARLVPHIFIRVVVRPENLIGLDIPPNVLVTCNIPVRAAMTLLAHSKFMVLPLKNATVPCGHVTLVAAFHLGKATVITESAGVDDYLGDGTFTRTCKANDPQSLAREIETLWIDDDLVSSMGCRAKAFAKAYCSEQAALSYLDDLLRREGL